MRADSVDDEHPEREEDPGSQFGNLEDILKTGQESLKHCG
jgi:hypothetical protein